MDIAPPPEAVINGESAYVTQDGEGDGGVPGAVDGKHIALHDPRAVPAGVEAELTM